MEPLHQLSNNAHQHALQQNAICVACSRYFTAWDSETVFALCHECGLKAVDEIVMICRLSSPAIRLLQNKESVRRRQRQESLSGSGSTTRATEANAAADHGSASAPATQADSKTTEDEQSVDADCITVENTVDHSVELPDDKTEQKDIRTCLKSTQVSTTLVTRSESETADLGIVEQMDVDGKPPQDEANDDGEKEDDLNHLTLSEFAPVQSRIDTNAYNVMREVCEKLALPRSIMERSMDIVTRYQQHVKRKLRGNESREAGAASIFLSCKLEQTRRTFREISNACGVAVKGIGAIAKRMELALPDTKVGHETDTDDLVWRICTALALPDSITGTAQQVATSMGELPDVHGRTYATIAATSVAIVCQLGDDSIKRTIREVAQSAGIAEGTIRNTVKAAGMMIADCLPPGF